MAPITATRSPRCWVPPAAAGTGSYSVAAITTAVQQEVTRAHAADRWALDGVALNSEVTEYDRVEQVRNPPPEGVYISGLFLDGATWDKSGNALAESLPKALFCDMPILFVTAVTKSQRKGTDLGPFGGFVCPVYKYQKRTDKYIIFSVTLTSQQKPEHWMALPGCRRCHSSGTSILLRRALS